MRTFEHHSFSHRSRTNARAVDDGQRPHTVRPAGSGEREIILQIEHRLAAADHDISVGIEFGELRDQRRPSGNRQIVVAVVVIPLPKVAVLALQVAPLVHFDEHEARRS